MNSTAVQTKNASLDTLAVTIQALHVSGKQMTLAVFRQLPRATESEDSELWGVVRYAIKYEGDLWLVFSHNGSLYRRAIFLSEPTSYFGKIPDLEKSIFNLRRRMELSQYYQTKENEERVCDWEGQLELEKQAYKERLAASAAKCAREKSLSEMPQLFIAV